MKKHFCACGCGKEIPFRKHYKYKGWPKYLRGHNSRGINKKIKDYMIPENIEKYLLKHWVDKKHVGKHFKTSETTIRDKMYEFGLTYNGIAQRRMNKINGNYILFMPRAKKINVKTKLIAYPKITQVDKKPDGSFIPLIRSLMVEQTGIGYLSNKKMINPQATKIEITISPTSKPQYKIEEIKYLEMTVSSEILEYFREAEITNDMKQKYGSDVNIIFN